MSKYVKYELTNIGVTDHMKKKEFEKEADNNFKAY